MAECNEMIGKGGVFSFKCRVRATPHNGPHAAPERPATMRQRAAWLASTGNGAADPLTDPPTSMTEGTSSLAAHVAADAKTNDQPVDDRCSDCLGIGSELCLTCHGTGVKETFGPIFYVHDPIEKTLAAHDAEGILARLRWDIKDGEVVMVAHEVAGHVKGERGAVLGDALAAWVRERAQEGKIGQAYDGRIGEIVEASAVESSVVEPVLEPEPAPVEVKPETIEPTKQRPEDQPLPQTNNHPVIQDLVVKDIEERKKLGIQRYGTPLQAFNGRNMVRDAYEESLDLAVYLRGVEVERAATKEWVRELVDVLERIFPSQGEYSEGYDSTDDIERMESLLAMLMALYVKQAEAPST